MFNSFSENFHFLFPLNETGKQRRQEEDKIFNGSFLEDESRWDVKWKKANDKMQEKNQWQTSENKNIKWIYKIKA